MSTGLAQQSDLDPVTAMFAAFAAQNFPVVAQVALEIEARALAVEEDDEERDAAAMLAAFSRGMHHYALALPAAIALQFAEAKSHFVEASRALSFEMRPDTPEMFRFFTKRIDLSASISVPLIEAQENLLLGNLLASQKSIAAADVRMRQAIASLAAYDSDTDEAIAMRSAVIGDYLGFYIAGTLVHMTTGPILGNTSLSLKFVEEHEAGLAKMIGDLGQDASILDAVDPLRLLGRAAAVSLRADAAIAKGHFEEAVSLFDKARNAFWDASSNIPDSVPFAAKIREASFNRATMMPQAERYAELLRQHGDMVSRLTDENAALEGRIKEVERDYFGRLKDFGQQRLNLTIDSKNINQLENQVSNEVTVTQSNLQMIQDRSLDQILVLLEGIRNDANEGRVREIKKEVGEARQEKDLAKKIERVAAILDAVGSVAEAATELVPYGKTVYRVLKGVLTG